MMIINESFHFRIDAVEVGPLVEVGETVDHVSNVEERFVRTFPSEIILLEHSESFSTNIKS